MWTVVYRVNSREDIDATALMGDGRGVGGSEDGGGPPASLWCNWSDDPEILKTLLAEFNRPPIGEGERVSGDTGGDGGGGDDGGEAEGGQEKGEESGESSDVHLHLSEVCLEGGGGASCVRVCVCARAFLW